MVTEVTPDELRARLEGDHPPLVLDVREEWELDIAPFAGALHIEMAEFPDALEKLPRDRDIVVLCHHGGRSYSVAMVIARAGMSAANLAGGIDAWSRDIDPSVPAY